MEGKLDAAKTNEKAAAETETTEVEESKFLMNLCILPPLQKGETIPVVTQQTSEKTTTKDDAPNNPIEGLIHLPPIRAEEPVASLRAALSEVRGYSHITHYRLVLDPENQNSSLSTPAPKDDVFDTATITVSDGKAVTSSSNQTNSKNAKKKKKKNKDNQKSSQTKESTPGSTTPVPSTTTPTVAIEEIVSSFTGPNAMIMAPHGAKIITELKTSTLDNTARECILDDYGDLTPLLAGNQLKDGSAFRMILTRYDAAGIRDHVTRLRSILDGNAPFVLTLDENHGQFNDEEESMGANENTAADENEVSDSAAQQSKKSKEDGTGKAKDSTATDEDKEEQQRKLHEEARATHLKEMAEKMPSFPFQSRIAIDGNNIQDYYYLSCGEEEALFDVNEENTESKNNEIAEDKLITAKLEELDEIIKVKCIIRYSGFNPPPSHRRLVGDIAYLEISTPGSNEGVVHVTATPMGFYVNRTSPNTSADNRKNPFNFNPAPAPNSCFSHELLDCLLKRSKSFRASWANALAAAKERANIISTTTAKDSPLKALHRVAIRSSLSSLPHQSIDSLVLRPSWVVPDHGESHDVKHDYNINRSEDDLASTYGLDIRGGALRDWNEELQSAREMPKETLQERIERARMVHKVLTDFSEASLIGAMAILDGHVTPMNPNEPTRSHVYLHNNIFFSRAVDAGADTFKVSQGDRAARKSASRDTQCMGALHRLDITGLHTLATVLVDYLGTRLVCQSIVPGILHGEKTHTLLYGAVEATSPLTWDEDMHSALENAIGKGLMVGSVKVPTWPLSKERMDTILAIKGEEEVKDEAKVAKEEKLNETTLMCGPVEAKGIKGSDQRRYILDLTRLTPRDANWVSKEDGGTGNWEQTWSESSKKVQKLVPKTVADDEWTMAVLRPEIITHITHKEMTDYLKKKTIKESIDKEKAAQEKSASDGAKEEQTDKKPSSQESTTDEKSSPENPTPAPENTESISEDIQPEDEEYLNSLRYNVNVFLPNTKSLAEIDTPAYLEYQKDEERVRAAANHLWNNVLPSITQEMRENSSISAHQIPVDGMTLTETLHSRGINCRYLGRLAQLATKEEQTDRDAEAAVVSGKAPLLPRKTMPLCWLELLECEIVARASKHVLDRYLSEDGGAASTMPAETIASFLSAVLSSREETAGETELRIKKQDDASNTAGYTSSATDEELSSMTISYLVGGDALPSQTRSRSEVWADIEAEVGRRFRYSLTLYNTKVTGKDDKPSPRALLVPLLRRICQRAGLRIAAKNYDLGRKGLCSTSSTPGRISASYPISPVDIVDILPMVKHAAAHGGEGFVPCSLGATVGSPSLHILLPDAKAAFEAAHAHWNVRSLPKALDLTQEAASLYQQVVDTPLHASVSRCLDLTAVILFQAQEPELAAANAARALAVAVQLGGFDCAEAVTAHTTLGHILISSGGLAGGVKHLRAALYLMEMMGGSNYAELANMYHKLGTMYHEVSNGITALRFYQEAARRQVSDRMVEGMISKSTALVLAGLGQFKSALESERKAYGIYKLILGEEHEMTITSANSVKHLMKLAVEQGTRLVAEEKKRLEVEAADAIASKIEADEAEEKKKKKKKKKSKKKT